MAAGRLTRADVAKRYAEVLTLAGWKDTTSWAAHTIVIDLETRGLLSGEFRQREGSPEYLEGPHVRIDTKEQVFSIWPLRGEVSS